MTPHEETAFRVQRMVLTILLKRANGLVRLTRKEVTDYHSDQLIMIKWLEENSSDYADIFLMSPDDTGGLPHIEDVL